MQRLRGLMTANLSSNSRTNRYLFAPQKGLRALCLRTTLHIATTLLTTTPADSASSRRSIKRVNCVSNLFRATDSSNKEFSECRGGGLRRLVDVIFLLKFPNTETQGSAARLTATTRDLSNLYFSLEKFGSLVLFYYFCAVNERGGRRVPLFCAI